MRTITFYILTCIFIITSVTLGGVYLFGYTFDQSFGIGLFASIAVVFAGMLSYLFNMC